MHIVLKLKALVHLLYIYLYVEAQSCNFYTLPNNSLISICVDGRLGRYAFIESAIYSVGCHASF